MIENNVIAFTFHFFYSMALIFLVPHDEFNFLESAALYLIILVPYFLLGFLSGKKLEYYDSKIRNLLSFSSIFIVGILLWLIAQVIYYYEIIYYFYFAAVILFESLLINFLGNSAFRSIFIALLGLPTILLVWLGQELRMKNYNAGPKEE